MTRRVPDGSGARRRAQPPRAADEACGRAHHQLIAGGKGEVGWAEGRVGRFRRGPRDANHEGTKGCGGGFRRRCVPILYTEGVLFQEPRQKRSGQCKSTKLKNYRRTNRNFHLQVSRLFLYKLLHGHPYSLNFATLRLGVQPIEMRSGITQRLLILPYVSKS